MVIRGYSWGRYIKPDGLSIPHLIDLDNHRTQCGIDLQNTGYDTTTVETSDKACGRCWKARVSVTVKDHSALGTRL